MGIEEKHYERTNEPKVCTCGANPGPGQCGGLCNAMKRRKMIKDAVRRRLERPPCSNIIHKKECKHTITFNTENTEHIVSKCQLENLLKECR